MTKDFDVMAAGHVCFDIIPKFMDGGAGSIRDVLLPGKLINIGNYTLSTGGPVSNTGIGLKKLGHSVCFCASIGDDEFGKLTETFLKKYGNSEAIRVVKDQSSSYTIVIAPPNEDRIFLHSPGTNNLFSSDDIDYTLVNRCRHFHFGYPPLMANMYKDDGNLLKNVFKIAKDAGAITSCDMSLPDLDSESAQANWRNILENILPYVDIFLPSIEEIFFMLERESYLNIKKSKKGSDIIDYLSASDYSNLASQLLDMGTRMTSLKSGHRGFYFKTGPRAKVESLCDKSGQNPETWANRELWCPAFQVKKIASATGSGDSSISGFLSAFLHRLPIEKCLKYACILGWENLQVLDAVNGIKSWQETTDLLNQDLPLINVEINERDWKWCDDNKLWGGPNDLLTKDLS